MGDPDLRKQLLKARRSGAPQSGRLKRTTKPATTVPVFAKDLEDGSVLDQSDQPDDPQVPGGGQDTLVRLNSDPESSSSRETTLSLNKASIGITDTDNSESSEEVPLRRGRSRSKQPKTPAAPKGKGTDNVDDSLSKTAPARTRRAATSNSLTSTMSVDEEEPDNIRSKPPASASLRRKRSAAPKSLLDAGSLHAEEVDDEYLPTASIRRSPEKCKFSVCASCLKAVLQTAASSKTRPGETRPLRTKAYRFQLNS